MCRLIFILLCVFFLFFFAFSLCTSRTISIIIIIIIIISTVALYSVKLRRDNGECLQSDQAQLLIRA